MNRMNSMAMNSTTSSTYFQVCVSRGWQRLEVSSSLFNRSVLASAPTFQALYRHFLLHRKRTDLLTETQWEVHVRPGFGLEATGWVEASGIISVSAALDACSATCVRFVLPASAVSQTERKDVVACSGGFSPDLIRGISNTMDLELFDDLCRLLNRHGCKFPSKEEGRRFVSALRDLLWTVESSIDHITRCTGKTFPTLLSSEALRDWTEDDRNEKERRGKAAIIDHGYNQYLRRKEPKPIIDFKTLDDQLDALNDFLGKPWMDSPKFQFLRPAVAQLVEFGDEYVAHLELSKPQSGVQKVS